MAFSDWGNVEDWRNWSGIDSSTINDAQASRFLTWSVQQVQREATQLIRDELVTKDGTSGYYFTRHRYFSDYEMASPDASVGTDDVVVYEYDSTNRVLEDITSTVASIDGLNNYFTLQSGYPTSNRSVYATYRIIGRPLTEVVGLNSDGSHAVYSYMTLMALRELKRVRLLNGIISYTSGGETVTRDEKTFDDLVNQQQKDYEARISNLKPFYGRSMKTGNGGYGNRQNRLSQQGPPYSFGGRLLGGHRF